MFVSLLPAEYAPKGISETARRELQVENDVGPSHPKLPPSSIFHCYAEAKAVSGS